MDFGGEVHQFARHSERDGDAYRDCQMKALAGASRLGLAAAFTVSLVGAPTQQSPSTCARRPPAEVEVRAREIGQAPATFFNQLELAVCYDQAWWFEDVEPAIVKAAARLDAEIAAAPSTHSSSKGLPVGGDGVPLPRRTRDAQADYPQKALLAGMTGMVIVELIIDSKGNVRQARVAKSVPVFDDAAMKAAKKWKYEPTVVGGKPTEVLTFAAVRFGQTMEPIPSDWMAMAALHYEQGRLKLARGSLDAALTKSLDDRRRFGANNPARISENRAGVTAPVRTKLVEPHYPMRAQMLGMQGVVVIEALIDVYGNVGRAHIVSKPSVLDAAALEAVLQWKFTPASRDGSPEAVVMTVSVDFNLR
jgi:TonB family protein